MIAESLRSNPRKRDPLRREADVLLRAGFFRDLRDFEDGDIKMLGRVATRIVTDGSADAYPLRADCIIPRSRAYPLLAGS